MSEIERIKQARIVPVIRKANLENIVPITTALVKGGIQAIEITAETPRVGELIQKVKENVSDELMVGAGTVLDPETARQLMLAGAEFIVSPSLNTETIRMANRYGIPCIPGALTPTEILTAYEAGANMVKVFPAHTFGPHYIKNIKGPLPHVSVMATGGIHLENMMDYFENGAEVVGIGSQLVNATKLTTEEDYQNLETLAGSYKEKIAEMND
ncbi:bifunctional 4-hydroxy-2-oxoglutarate aldolase/2-dehydro-3-deoxy-phosphogluconate aldolase [Halobacillus seohaensis]|uniref:Bifunctional 4-hydroxy-2-oxoglutarate aldolase/2-dehydro-3-deoxy-phosphogluconate aldolase n=1 Tax=Halobacillus seohaensis TaxID=447421 RepID=A0ABW2EPS4_9BACI